MHEILPHTADVRVRIVSRDERGLFVDGAAALREVAGTELDDDGEETRTIAVDANDLTSLLVDFLNELVFLLAARRLVARQVEIAELSPGRVVARVALARASCWERDVKAVTYHDAEVRFGEDGWTTTLVLDI